MLFGSGYARLGGLNNKIFTSKYKLALPSEEIRLKFKSVPRLLKEKK
jgi:hypothetical protein